MEFVPVSTPSWIDSLIPGVIWRFTGLQKNIYLTFDDGPIPEVTPWVLGLLKRYNAKATFFCIGENVDRHPHIYKQIIEEGHAVGNHTQKHLKGWATGNKDFYRDILECSNRVESNLFRPPYGKITQGQLRHLKKRFCVVMWSVLSKDYDEKLSPIACLENSLACGPGDIIVFHDSIKAEEKLRFILPKFLKHYSDLGYEFKAITA
ncbi:MAG: polysaccharide deacetylase family protein [Luteibaculum sp.]